MTRTSAWPFAATTAAVSAPAPEPTTRTSVSTSQAEFSANCWSFHLKSGKAGRPPFRLSATRGARTGQRGARFAHASEGDRGERLEHLPRGIGAAGFGFEFVTPLDEGLAGFGDRSQAEPSGDVAGDRGFAEHAIGH